VTTPCSEHTDTPCCCGTTRGAVDAGMTAALGPGPLSSANAASKDAKSKALASTPKVPRVASSALKGIDSASASSCHQTKRAETALHKSCEYHSCAPHFPAISALQLFTHPRKSQSIYCSCWPKHPTQTSWAVAACDSANWDRSSLQVFSATSCLFLASFAFRSACTRTHTQGERQ
jgi:hypothetical protein